MLDTLTGWLQQLRDQVLQVGRGNRVLWEIDLDTGQRSKSIRQDSDNNVKGQSIQRLIVKLYVVRKTNLFLAFATLSHILLYVTFL